MAPGDTGRDALGRDGRDAGRDRPATRAAAPAHTAAAGLGAAGAGVRAAAGAGGRQPPAGRAADAVAALAGTAPDRGHQPGQRVVGGPAGGGPAARRRGPGRGAAAAGRRRHLVHQRDRLRAVVLGIRPRRPDGPGARGAAVRRLPLRADAEPRAGARGLGAGVPRLPVSLVHQRNGLQPDRRDAPVALVQDADAAAVLGVPGDRGPRGGARRQHPEVAGGPSVPSRPIGGRFGLPWPGRVGRGHMMRACPRARPRGGERRRSAGDRNCMVRFLEPLVFLRVGSAP
ncbi:hypothetical protein SGPA1_21488 [Streptomyces misionensis JCM 4497]